MGLDCAFSFHIINKHNDSNATVIKAKTGVHVPFQIIAIVKSLLKVHLNYCNNFPQTKNNHQVTTGHNKTSE